MSSTEVEARWYKGSSKFRYAPLPDRFCPSCGAKGGIWRMVGDGDYYLGSESVCVECGDGGNLDAWGDSRHEETVQDILGALLRREGADPQGETEDR